MPRPISIREIQDAVARHYNITVNDMLPYRSRRHLRPRCIAMFLARTLTAHSRAEIARYFGRCQDETVTYAARRIARLMEKDAMLAGTVMAIRAELEASAA